MNVIFTFKSSGPTTVVVSKNKIKIFRRGHLNLFNSVLGENSIQLSSISHVVIKKPRFFNGHVKLVLNPNSEIADKVSIIGNELFILFRGQIDYEIAQQLKQYIEQSIGRKSETHKDYMHK